MPAVLATMAARKLRKFLNFSSDSPCSRALDFALSCGCVWTATAKADKRCVGDPGLMTRVGFYPGTFDPIHNGHTDVIGRAVKLVDKLVIGVAINAGKGPLFSLEERVAIVEEITDIGQTTGGIQNDRSFIAKGEGTPAISAAGKGLRIALW